MDAIAVTAYTNTVSGRRTARAPMRLLPRGFCAYRRGTALASGLCSLLTDANRARKVTTAVVIACFAPERVHALPLVGGRDAVILTQRALWLLEVPERATRGLGRAAVDVRSPWRISMRLRCLRVVCMVFLVASCVLCLPGASKMVLQVKNNVV